MYVQVLQEDQEILEMVDREETLIKVQWMLIMEEVEDLEQEVLDMFILQEQLRIIHQDAC